MIDETIEEAVSGARGRARQSKTVPFVIRDDGILFPNVPLIAKKPNFRPYHGKVDASIEERMRYLAGFSMQKRAVVSSAPVAEAEPFDIAKASKDEIIVFAFEEFGLSWPDGTHLNRIRADVAKAAGIPVVNGKIGGMPAATGMAGAETAG